MKTGVIGLGAMGAPMALNLHRAGHLAAIWNRTPARAMDVCRDTGIALCEDIAALARQCEAIITSVSADRDVLEVAQKISDAASAGCIVIDTSTVAAQTARQAAALLAEKGIDFLDAPVSGGVEGAKNGTLSIMAGGDATVLEKARPALEAVSARITHIGPVGSGQATKAVNQMMVAGINQAVTQSLAFGQALRLPMDKVIKAVSGGAAGNWFLQHRGPSMVAGQFAPGFRVALHDKDLGICQRMAEDAGRRFPAADKTREEYAALMRDGHGDEDISALFRLKTRV